jgi:hypothetical protein
MNVTDIPVVFICPSHNEKYKAREERMWTFLKECGFKYIEHFKSGHEAYPTCLAQATRDILSTRLDDNPFMLVEDDIELTQWARLDVPITYPSNADAMYLGFSRGAGSMIHNIDCGAAQIDIVNDTYIKIENMLSAHAIIYISERYKRAVMNQMDYSIANPGYYNDVLISRIQHKYNVYGYHYPFFYQTDPPNADGTNFRFK